MAGCRVRWWLWSDAVEARAEWLVTGVMLAPKWRLRRSASVVMAGFDGRRNLLSFMLYIVFSDANDVHSPRAEL